MAESGRNRAEGWQYAKLSGHSNEELVKHLLDSNRPYTNQFLKRIGCEGFNIINTSIGGLHETNVPSVLGKTTKSKTDLRIVFDNGKTVNISIKKSLGGQVYLIRAGNFIKIFEKQFNKKIPNDVQRAIKLFWAEAEDAVQIIEKYADKDEKNFDQQIRHQSLNATTLKKYNESLYDSLLNWFKLNVYELTKLAFSMGAASKPSDWSNFVWYINRLGEEDEENIDEIFNIEDICEIAKKYAKDKTCFGDKNGGTTIQLPFGFVQWHQHQMQFHHQYEKIFELFSR